MANFPTGMLDFCGLIQECSTSNCDFTILSSPARHSFEAGMMIPLVLEVVCEISAMFSIEQQNFYLFVQLVSCVSWIFMVKTCGDYGELGMDQDLLIPFLGE